MKELKEEEKKPRSEEPSLSGRDKNQNLLIEIENIKKENEQLKQKLAEARKSEALGLDTLAEAFKKVRGGIKFQDQYVWHVPKN